MALIKCEECGQMVSDKAAMCPHCGAPIKKKMVCGECGTELTETDKVCPNCGCPIEKKIVCKECGAELTETDKVCPNCGCPSESPIPQSQNSSQAQKPHHPNKYPIPFKVFLCAMGIVVYLLAGHIGGEINVPKSELKDLENGCNFAINRGDTEDAENWLKAYKEKSAERIEAEIVSCAIITLVICLICAQPVKMKIIYSFATCIMAILAICLAESLGEVIGVCCTIVNIMCIICAIWIREKSKAENIRIA